MWSECLQTEKTLGTTKLFYDEVGVSPVPRYILSGSKADPYVGVTGNISVALCQPLYLGPMALG